MEAEPTSLNLRNPEDLSWGKRLTIAGTVIAISFGDMFRHPVEHGAQRNTPKAAEAIDKRIINKTNRLLRLFKIGPLQ